jgi:hypothetical protein
LTATLLAPTAGVYTDLNLELELVHHFYFVLLKDVFVSGIGTEHVPWRVNRGQDFVKGGTL